MSKGTIKAAAAVVLIGGLIALGVVFDVASYLRQAMQWIEGLGLIGVFAFIALYAACTVLLIPGTIPTFAAGAIFGVAQGTVLVSLGSTIGAVLAFFVGRYLARDAVSNAVSKNPKFAAIDEVVGREGWKIIGLLRLSPVVPFSLSNYFYGITAVKPVGYTLASWIGMLPGTIMYVYIGSLLGLAAAGGGQGMTTGQVVMMVVGLAATVAVTIFITRIAKKAINEKMATSGDTAVATALAAEGAPEAAVENKVEA
jgi:uncharacterized membrane protein YdjX (TVP38/TMEM64 family)